ncbi:hypothetical protein IP70_10370 [alpha proteobacterium AAP38]|nr:hypothetical protein IP70_10370 [alpha proteobacterium AAP38]
MVTEIGKELRKLRIDKDERLLDMAEKVERSPAFLSAVETGRKAPPDGFGEMIVKAYRLTGEAAERLLSAFDKSRDNFRIYALNPFARDTAGLLARKFDTLSDDQLKEIQTILKRGEK